ncbi:hypothetical protein PSTG_15431 [Puccinia striiformis f. sp. tritici PST-78]|uniref:Uncharacterized protein n=1 Tax=Puccinia striiformis f. sp. tritici PST-78 TaxID=1165861 RepID=A0A0L0UVX6_9BASI|nr:hypothetical protein PSTG_15431 [Puccinia striiformis f. sp. tritici PST-78]
MAEVRSAKRLPQAVEPTDSSPFCRASGKQGPGQSGPLRATPVAPNPAPRVGEEIDRTWDRPLVGQLNAIGLDMTTCSVVAVTSPPPSPLVKAALPQNPLGCDCYAASGSCRGKADRLPVAQKCLDQRYLRPATKTVCLSNVQVAD